ncbi:hypothetical protein [Planktotalea sp.]|uniref:hypothetical protein n=1 Tax=Planktotalea sp. TaxID=2029877 RepID=UPI0025D1FCE0|nr:hypothetical protein [Planktotalea sp.]
MDKTSYCRGVEAEVQQGIKHKQIWQRVLKHFLSHFKVSFFIAYSNPKADFCAEAAEGRFVPRRVSSDKPQRTARIPEPVVGA